MSPTHETLRIAVISDLNERYGDQYHREAVHTAVRRLEQWRPDLILVAGDMVAGQREGLDHIAMWNAFHAAVSDPLAAFPMAVTPGNHDASGYPRYVEERRIYAEEWLGRPNLDRFDAIEFVDGDNYPFNYSFTVGPAMVISIDGTRRDALSEPLVSLPNLRAGPENTVDHPAPESEMNGTSQLAWLETQLATADRTAHPIVIVFSHLPPYPFAQDRERDWLMEDPDVRSAFDALLAENDVSLWVSGHHHAYYPGRSAASGLRVVGTGCLGGGPRRLIGDDRIIEDPQDPSERSVLFITVADSALVGVEAFHGPQFSPDDLISRDGLPRSLGEGPSQVDRDDL